MQEKILMVSLSNIGDAIMTTPVLKTLHQIYPLANIDIVADPRSAIIFQNCPFRGSLYIRDKKAGIRGYYDLIMELRKFQYLCVVDLKTAWFPYTLRTKLHLGRFAKKNKKTLHAVEDLMSVIKYLQTNTIPTVEIWIDKLAYQFADRTLTAYPNQRILTLGPGANWPPKIWPLTHFSSLLNALDDLFDLIILLGDKNEQPRAKQLSELLNIQHLNLAGKTDLMQTAALIARSDYFLGNDSGLGHIAAAVAVPSFTVFGPTQASRYHPWSDQAAYILAPEKNLDALLPQVVEAQLREHIASLSHKRQKES